MNSFGSLVFSFLLLHPPATPKKTAAAASPALQVLLPKCSLSFLFLCPCPGAVYKDTSLSVSACASEAGGMGMLRCHNPSPLKVPPSNQEAPKAAPCHGILAVDPTRLMLAGERGRSRSRSKVFSPLSPPEAAAKQHFDREAGRDSEGHRALLQQLRDPVC